MKEKCINEQEFVIGGFTLPSNGGDGLGALLLGYYEGGQLRYAGRVGTGFTQSTTRTAWWNGSGATSPERITAPSTFSADQSRSSAGFP